MPGLKLSIDISYPYTTETAAAIKRAIMILLRELSPHDRALIIQTIVVQFPFDQFATEKSLKPIIDAIKKIPIDRLPTY